MLADGYFEGFYKGDKVAIRHFNGCIEVYVAGEWIRVARHHVEVAYTVRIFKEQQEVYSAVSDTPNPRYMPKDLPSGWLVAS